MSACFAPENRLVGVVERPLGPGRRICQFRGAGMDATVPGTLGVALCRARIAQMAAMALCRTRGGQLVAFPQGWRKLAPRRSRVRGGWSTSYAARTGEPILLAGGSGWWSGGPSSVSSPERSSGSSPRLESRDLERAVPVSWVSRLGRVEDLNLPRFLIGIHVVACCRSAKVSIAPEQSSFPTDRTCRGTVASTVVLLAA